MRLSYKYRIYPNQEQVEILEKIFNFCCFLYNCALQERKDYYKKYGKSIGYNNQADHLSEIKEWFSDQVDNIYSQTLQQVLKRVDIAYQNFFSRIKKGTAKPGFPRFKSKNQFNSILFPQANLVGGKGGIRLLDNGKFKIFGLGEVKVKIDRPFQGRCKNVTIVRKADKYYVVLSCDDVPPNPLPKTGKTVAIDLGLESFITTDENIKFHHPKPYKTSKEKLAYLNQKLARKQKGSNNRKKAVKELQRAHEKVSNIREDFQHKLSLQLVKDYDQIIIEDLNISSMLESENHLVKNSNIADAAWGSFVNKLVYKAERAGKQIIKVNPRNTSKMCSGCGKIMELTLKDRKFCCADCEFATDRDHNAALNIKRLGISLAIGNKISISKTIK